MGTSKPHDKLASICHALAHPVRVQLLEQLEHGPASPMDLARRSAVDGEIGTVSYHCRTLRDGGLIKVAARETKRGAVKTSYELTTLGTRVGAWLVGLAGDVQAEAGPAGS